jgi:hypothetical protein
MGCSHGDLIGPAPKDTKSLSNAGGVSRTRPERPLNGHFPCPPGWRRVNTAAPATACGILVHVQGSPRGRWAATEAEWGPASSRLPHLMEINIPLPLDAAAEY